MRSSSARLAARFSGPLSCTNWRAGDRLGRVAMERHGAGPGLRQAELLERRPRARDEVPHPSLGALGRVMHRDLQAVGHEQRRPACADRAGADHRHPLDRGMDGSHGQRRYSMLASTPIAWPETRRPASEQR